MKNYYGYIIDIAFSDQKYKENPNQGLSSINPCKKVKHLTKNMWESKSGFLMSPSITSLPPQIEGVLICLCLPNTHTKELSHQPWHSAQSSSNAFSLERRQEYQVLVALISQGALLQWEEQCEKSPVTECLYLSQYAIHHTVTCFKKATGDWPGPPAA